MSFIPTDGSPDTPRQTTQHLSGMTWIMLKPPVRGSKRWRKRQRRIRQGKFAELHQDWHNEIFYENATGPSSEDYDDLDDHFRPQDVACIVDTDEDDAALDDVRWSQLPFYQPREITPEYLASELSSQQLYVDDSGERTPRALSPRNLSHWHFYLLRQQQAVAKHTQSILPELFLIILSHVEMIHRSEYQADARYKRLRRHSYWNQNKQERDPLGDLRAFSLVCRHWANLCRRSMFGGATLFLRSPEDVELLVKYATRGSPSLVPVYKLIRGIDVSQRCDSSPSFLHRLQIITGLMDESAFRVLVLLGPIPSDPSHARLDTPRRSVPPPPFILPFAEIKLMNVHLPSFDHVVSYISHLTHAREGLVLSDITWSGSAIADEIPPSHFHHKNSESPVRSRRTKMSITAARCTDNFTLCLYAMLSRPDCPLHCLPADESQRVVALMTQLYSAGDPCRSVHTHTSFSWEVTQTSPSSFQTPEPETATYPFMLRCTRSNILGVRSGGFTLTFDRQSQPPLHGSSLSLPLRLPVSGCYVMSTSI